MDSTHAVHTPPVAHGAAPYIALVVTQTLVLPLVSATLHLSLFVADPLVVLATWWGFWGVGTRLVVAGVSQLKNPSRTTRGILGIEDRGAEQIVHELGYANLALGLVALATPFAGRTGAWCAAAGALYLGMAGARHWAKKERNASETVAMWTDLLVFVMVAAGGVALAIA